MYSSERIKRNKEFLRKTWNLENDRPAARFYMLPMPESKDTWLERFYEPRKNLDYQMKIIKLHSGIMDDNVPTLDTFLGTALFPSAFGCRIHYYDHQDPWAHPLIINKPGEVYNLPCASVEDGDLKYVINTTKYFEEKAGMQFPIKIGDPQSPIDIAYLIWKEEEFMMAMYEHPAEVHKLLEKVTDLFIRFFKKQKSMVTEFSPSHMPNIWAPSDLGIGISDDLLAVLSPKLYEEFALPYINAISEEFGGILLHSCGNITHNLDNVAKIKNLKCINFGASETPVGNVFKGFAGKTAIAIHPGLNNSSMGVASFDSLLNFAKHILNQKKTNEGLLLYLVTETPVPFAEKTTRESIDRILDLTHR
jgi:uroporphyrinogen-III decarboxylase